MYAKITFIKQNHFNLVQIFIYSDFIQIDQLIVIRLIVDQLIGIQLNIDQLIVIQLTIDQLIVFQLTIDQLVSTCASIVNACAVAVVLRTPPMYKVLGLLMAELPKH